jgi:hypothetical protein
MKRLIVTTFAVLYTFALIVGGMDRTSTWVAQKAEAALEKEAGPGVQAAKDFTKHHPNRRIIQSQFVVAPPVLESGITLVSTLYKFHASSVFVWRLDGAPVPSRAPPSLT